jgi:hypothetical protein
MNKKIIILALFSLFLFTSPAHATRYVPPYVDSVVHWGIGLVKVDKTITIYKENSASSPVLEVISWNERGKIDLLNNRRHNIAVNHIFTAFVGSHGAAFLSMEDEDDEWLKVCYDQKHQKFGWIKKSEGHEAFFWGEFFNAYARQSGLYFFRDIQRDKRRLYSRPEDNSQAVASFEHAKHINLWLIRGNWMLVKVTNYDNTVKTGWIRWRNDEGRLFAFVELR